MVVVQKEPEKVTCHPIFLYYIFFLVETRFRKGSNFINWVYAEKFTISTLEMTKYEGRGNGKFYIYP